VGCVEHGNKLQVFIRGRTFLDLLSTYQLSKTVPSLTELISSSKWNLIWFIYRAHQNHFEQMGHLNATIEINGERHFVKMPSFRDHSSGK
jgi:hypothetical protein